MKCARCGQALPPLAKFCPECAHPTGLSSVRQSPARFASPDSYTPRHIAERILTSKTSIEGERKQITVLFADLKGSMEMLADRDPEEARKILDPVLERMMEAVHRYEGTVNEVRGDGIMALFGAPLAHEDHALRACYAALRMQDTVKRYAAEGSRAAGAPVQIRVGLNSGEVVVRSMGSDLRMDYSAIGRTTHLAARLEQLAPPGSILIAPATLSLADRYVSVKPLGARAIKGLETPIEVYELTGASATRSRLEVSAARGLTKFVGRAAEMERLDQALVRARAGHGQIAAVVGEPGVGKSRLCWELARSQRARGWLALKTGSVSYGKANPYLPVIELLRAYFQLHDGDDAGTVRERIGSRVAALGPALTAAVPAFVALLEAGGDEQWGALDPSQRRQRTLEACKRLFVRESRVQPLLLFFEDLQWLDSETQALLDGLVEIVPGERLFLLLSYRPEYQHEWSGRKCYTEMRVDPLRPEGAGELLETLLGNAAALEPLKQRLIEKTDGNPFFLEECVRTLMEVGVLAGERGAYRLARALETIPVPPTVEAVLAARIDRLQPEEKELLQAAAVIGHAVPLPVLQAIAERPEDLLRRGLASLQAAEFLYETTLFPDPEYSFKHALTHEVAYASLLRERRRALHAEIVAALERLFADRLIEFAERLAYHAVRGEIWAKALGYSRQAGAKAITRSSHREAAAFFDQALVALSHLPETRTNLELGIDLRIELRFSIVPLAELDRMLELLRRAEGLAEALGDRPRLRRVYDDMSNYFRLVGDYGAAIRASERTLGLAAELGESAVAESNYNLGMACRAAGDFHRAIAALATTARLPLTEYRGPALLAVHARAWLATVLAEIGEYGEAIDEGEQGRRTAEALGNPYSHMTALYGLGVVYLAKGEFDSALPLLEHSLTLCKEGAYHLLFPQVASALGVT